MKRPSVWQARLFYGLWLVLVLALCVFTKGFAAPLVLVLSLFVPLASALMARHSVKMLSLRLDVDGSATKDARVKGMLRIKNKSIMPLFRGLVSLKVKNRLTGETLSPELPFSLAGRSEENVPFYFEASQCGRVNIVAHSVYGMDIFGLSRARAESGTAAAASCTVFPDTFAPDISLGNSMAPHMDGEDYSTLKAGYDSSEVFSIRDYKAGDSPRSVHWKLTQKLDHIMVREAGLPLETFYMFLFETSCAEGAEPPSPEVTGSMAEVFCSVSQYLADAGLSHNIGWREAETGQLFSARVWTLDDLISILPRLLSTGISEGKSGSLDEYLKEETAYFEHLIYVTHSMPADLSVLYGHAGRVTVLHCTGETSGGSYGDDNVSVVTFSTKAYEEELSYIAI